MIPKKIFIGLLTGLIIQKCKIQPTLINLHPIEDSHEFHYYPFSVQLDRCVGSYNTINNLSNNMHSK